MVARSAMVTRIGTGQRALVVGEHGVAVATFLGTRTRMGPVN